MSACCVCVLYESCVRILTGTVTATTADRITAGGRHTTQQTIENTEKKERRII